MGGIDDAIAAFERWSAKARAVGAPAAADAMSGHFITHERTVTLVESGSHGRGSRGAAPRGAPPARVSGHLAESFRQVPAAGGGDSASSLAGPTAIYSRVQELGAVITKDPGYMHWYDYGGPQFRHRVNVGPHPYMRRGVEETILDGSLHDEAARAFAAAVGFG